MPETLEIDNQRLAQPARPLARQANVDERLAQLLLEKHRFEGDSQISCPKIQRVPAFLRQNAEFTKYCSPKIISFGPIHHGNEHLKQGENYKLMWTSMYIEEYSKETKKVTHQAAQFLHETIQDNLEELKKLFTEDAIGRQTADKDLTWMLFVDGCSLLYYMEHVDDQHPEALKLKLGQLMYIWRDIFLLENQLPRLLLELLSKKKGTDLEYLMANFNSIGSAKRSGAMTVLIENRAKSVHILDFARSFFTSASNDHTTGKDHVMENGKNVKNQQDGVERNQMAPREELYVWQRYKNIRDLKTAGIRVMASKGRGWRWGNISFTSKWFSGELRLPMLLINDFSPYFFRNMIAYEMCPDFHNSFECCSFFSFMDFLIDGAEDVKELRLAGVIQNLLGTDEELAKLFIDVGNDLPTKIFNTWSTDVMAYSKKYIQVKHQIEKHCTNKWKTWFAEAYNTHFSSPWSILGFLAAIVALALTYVQTWYQVHPKNP